MRLISDMRRDYNLKQLIPQFSFQVPFAISCVSSIIMEIIGDAFLPTSFLPAAARFEDTSCALRRCECSCNQISEKYRKSRRGETYIACFANNLSALGIAPVIRSEVA